MVIVKLMCNWKLINLKLSVFPKCVKLNLICNVLEFHNTITTINGVCKDVVRSFFYEVTTIALFLTCCSK